MPTTRPLSTSHTTALWYDRFADHLRHDYGRPRLRTMLTNPKAVAEEHGWDLLESECAELLFVLAVRIHYAHRRCLGNRASRRVLEASDEAVDQDWYVCPDEYDHAFSDCHYHQRRISPSFHRYRRSM